MLTPRTGKAMVLAPLISLLLPTTGCLTAYSPTDATTHVPQIVAQLTVAPTSLLLGPGTKGQLTASLKDSAGLLLTGNPITWTSSDPSVAQVSTAGVVTALKGGTASISVASGGQTAVAAVTVTGTLRQLAQARGFVMGTAINSSAYANDAQYRQVAAAQYNGLSMENALALGVVHPGPTTYSFTNSDQLAAFAQANGMAVHGGALMWYQTLPPWMASQTYTQAQLLAVLKNLITTVVGHYQGQFPTWDVVNEVFRWNGSGYAPTIWMTIIGPTYIDSSFVWTHEADPAAKLYINDYDMEIWPAKADSMFALVQRLRSNGVPIDGVGFETHLSSTPPAASVFQALYARFANAGFDVRISEMDERIPDTAGAQALVAQGETYSAVLDACLRLPQCTGFTSWGFTDRYSWIPGSFPGYGRALPLDSSYQPKPAYDSLVARLSRP